MTLERFEISGVASREIGTAADCHGRNHAIRQTTRSAAGLVEQTCGEYGVGGQEGLRLRKDLAGERLAGGVQRPAQELRPCDGADVQDFPTRDPSDELRMRDRTGDRDFNQEIGVQMDDESRDRTSTPCLANGIHPLRRFLCVEPQMMLQGVQGLQRGERGQGILAGLKNGQQAAALFGQLPGLLGHHPPVIDFNFQRQIAHGRILTDYPPVANQI
jgi:hypothetical protein